MAITVTEKMESRHANRGLVASTAEQHSTELRYIVRGTPDEVQAMLALIDAAPATVAMDADDVLPRLECGVDPIHIDTTPGREDTNLWEGVVKYGVKTKPETNESTFSFDTTGGTQHVTQSRMTINKYAAPGLTAPDFKGAIGATKDSVEGVDITVPVYSFSETHYLSPETVTQEYKQKLMNLTGKINGSEFRGFAIREVLFLGASGQMRNGEDWEITFKFAVSPAKSNMTVGDITGISKAGWSYMWVRYQDQVDTAANALVQRPVAVYIESVYEDGNFADLGIGA